MTDPKLHRTIAVTFSGMRTATLKEAENICVDYTKTAITTLADLRQTPGRPLRFIYVSGHFARHNIADVPQEIISFGQRMVDYTLLRVCDIIFRMLALLPLTVSIGGSRGICS
jgi:hypothetical protein